MSAMKGIYQAHGAAGRFQPVQGVIAECVFGRGGSRARRGSRFRPVYKGERVK